MDIALGVRNVRGSKNKSGAHGGALSMAAMHEHAFL